MYIVRSCTPTPRDGAPRGLPPIDGEADLVYSHVHDRRTLHSFPALGQRDSGAEVHAVAGDSRVGGAAVHPPPRDQSDAGALASGADRVQLHRSRTCLVVGRRRTSHLDRGRHLHPLAGRAARRGQRHVRVDVVVRDHPPTAARGGGLAGHAGGGERRVAPWASRIAPSVSGEARGLWICSSGPWGRMAICRRC